MHCFFKILKPILRILNQYDPPFWPLVPSTPQLPPHPTNCPSFSYFSIVAGFGRMRGSRALFYSKWCHTSLLILVSSCIHQTLILTWRSLLREYWWSRTGSIHGYAWLGLRERRSRRGSRCSLGPCSTGLCSFPPTSHIWASLFLLRSRTILYYRSVPFQTVSQIRRQWDAEPV